MSQKPKRIIINACVLSILASFIVGARHSRAAEASIIKGKVSAARGLNETADEAARRNYSANIMNGAFTKLEFTATAYDQLKPFPQVDLTQVTKWGNRNSLIKNFVRIRDLRFINSGDNFLRRLSWLYPDDGCFARADLERAQFEQWQLPAPNKIIISGDLAVKTPNSPDGAVSWWWHISEIVRVGDNYYVLDPAIDPLKPLLVQDWLAQMVPVVENANVVICSPYTYSIYDDCAQTEDQAELAMREQLQYLELEWQRQIELGRDPKMVLGARPPWAPTKP